MLELVNKLNENNIQNVLFNNRILCIKGDSLEILKLIDNKSIDFIMTDPPYDLTRKKQENYKEGKDGFYNRKIKQKNEIIFVQDGIDYEAFCNEFDRIIKYKNYCIYCSNKQIVDYISIYPENYELLIWNKTNAMPTCNNIMHQNVEYIIKIREKGAYFNNDLSVKEKSKVIVEPMKSANRLHPTQKPIEVLTPLIKLFSKEDDLVLDCFAGSGSTGVACKQLNRKCILIEREDNFYDVMVKRIDDEFRKLI